MPRWNDRWPTYTPVSDRRDRGARQVETLRRLGLQVQPVEAVGSVTPASVWGRTWSRHLESFSDYSNRLPRGRSYARHGSVIHLEVAPSRIQALVAGTHTYHVEIDIAPLAADTWATIQRTCSGRIGSLLELLEGRLSGEVMAVVADRHKGLLPRPAEIKLHCSCPDWAVMCKHVAAVLYGVGLRLDHEPEMLFTLRDVDPEGLIAGGMAGGVVTTEDQVDGLAVEDLGAIFGVTFDGLAESPPVLVADSSSSPFEPTGENIRRLRSQTGLTRQDFALKLGVSPASVARWEQSSGNLQLRERTRGLLQKLESEIRSGAGDE